MNRQMNARQIIETTQLMRMPFAVQPNGVPPPLELGQGSIPRQTCFKLTICNQKPDTYYYPADLTSEQGEQKNWQEHLDWLIGGTNPTFLLTAQKHPDHPEFQASYQKLMRNYIFDDSQLAVLVRSSTGFYQTAKACQYQLLALEMARSLGCANMLPQIPNLTVKSDQTLNIFPYPDLIYGNCSAAVLKTSDYRKKTAILNILNSAAFAILSLSTQKTNPLYKYQESGGVHYKGVRNLDALTNCSHGGIDMHVLEKFGSFDSDAALMLLVDRALPDDLKQAYNEIHRQVTSIYWGLINQGQMSQEKAAIIKNWLDLKPVNIQQHKDTFEKYYTFILAKPIDFTENHPDHQTIMRAERKVNELINSYRRTAAEVVEKAIADANFSGELKEQLYEFTGLNQFRLANPVTHASQLPTLVLNPLAAFSGLNLGR
jgi:hypothetical protein